MLANKALSSALSAEPVFVESVFSTYLYTGNGSTQTITNGIDLAGEGGLVWTKSRSSNTSSSNNHILTHSGNTALMSNSTNGSFFGGYINSFSSSGFNVQADGSNQNTNANGETYVSWTFRKAPKFFDVVTYTGDGSTTNRSISHSLGSQPGFVVIKRTNSTGNWFAYHVYGPGGNAFSGGYYNTTPGGNPGIFYLNTTAAVTYTGTSADGGYLVADSSTFTLANGGFGFTCDTNINGATYVAYLFAHDAGGFGEDGSENVISCGSYTGNGATGQLISLGYEPQWVLVKKSASPDSPNSSWALIDNMRGWAQSDSATLEANTSNAENAGFSASGSTSLDPQGFRLWNSNGALNRSGDTYIYIAIRRGPMKTPTTGTEVYNGVTYSGNDTARSITGSGFPVDLILTGIRNNIDVTVNGTTVDRLRGGSSSGAPRLFTTSTSADWSDPTSITTLDLMDGYKIGGQDGTVNNSNYNYVSWNLRRAPGFFDVVCYTGTGVATTVAHNLGVVPELMIVKNRVTGSNWTVKRAGSFDYAVLNTTQAFAGGFESALWNSTEPTASLFSVGTNSSVNASGNNYVAYLFASVPGVSKVFSYTGNGSSQTINCGFTGGARFVLIKRTDSTGDWYVWDSTRGIVAGNDPHLSLNTTAAEVTTDDSVDTDSTGFIVNQLAATNINVNAATYIGLAIA